MTLKELTKKIEQLNKMQKELELGDKYYLVVENRYSRAIYIYDSKSLKDIKNTYIKEIANKIINNDLIKVERCLYRVDGTQYEVRIGEM